MKYLIGIDLDGTLLPKGDVITEYTKDILTKVNNKGNKVVISTGRSYLGAVEFQDFLNLGNPMITLNGSLITFPDGTSIKKILPSDLVKDMFLTLADIIQSAIFNTTNYIYSHKHNDKLEKLFNGASAGEIKHFDVNDISYDILNGIILIEDNDKDKFEHYFSDKVIKARYWGSYEGVAFYDVYLQGVSKASALQELLDHYDLDKDNLITFGDGPNDLEMIKLAKYGYAMKNGKETLKQQTNLETKYDNNQDGVAKELEKFFKI